MRRSYPQHTNTAAMVVYDAALLVAVFYAPITWGYFNCGGQAFVATLVAIAALAGIVARRSQRRAPAAIPNAVHLPALMLVAISAISAAFGVSHHASAIELARIATGVLLFVLVANRALLPLAPAKPVVIAVACSAILLPFVRIPGETDVDLGALFAPATYAQTFTGVGASLRLFALVGLAALVGIIFSDRGRERPIRWYTHALIITGGFAVAASGLREKLLAVQILQNKSWQIFSTFFNPNPLGGFLAMGFFLALAAALADRVLWRRLVWTVAVLLLLGAIPPTYSKGAFVSLAVAAVVFLVLAAGATSNRARNLRIIALATLVVVLGIGLALYRVPSVRARVASSLDPQNTSNMFRILAWKGTARMALANPVLGIGPGGFKYAFMKYAIGGYTEAAHQNYLQVAAEQGFPGLAVFLWIIGAVIFSARRALARAPDFAARILAIGPIASLAVVLVHSFLDYDLYIGAIGLTFWLIVGMIAHYSHDFQPSQALPEPAPDSGRKRRAPRQAARPVVAEQGVHPLFWPAAPAARVVLVATFALLLCLTVSAPLRNALAQNALGFGDGAYAAGLSAFEQGDFTAMRNYFDTAFDDFRRMTEVDPGWSAAWERYGVILGTMGRTKEGEEAVRRAIALEPTSFQPYMSLAQRIYAEQGSQATSSADRQASYAKAAEAYRQALLRYPNNTRALRRLGAAYQQVGDTRNALAIYRRMEQVETSDYNKYRALADIDVDTEYAYAHYQLGRAAAGEYSTTGRRQAFDEAVREFSAALAVITAYQTGGGKRMDEMFKLVGQPRENRSGELQELEGRTRFRLSALYQRAGDQPAAAREADQALKLYPDVSRAVRTEDGGRPL